MAVIGRAAWPRCQQIHAIAGMLHGRRGGERRSPMIFGPKSLLYPHFEACTKRSCRLEFVLSARQSAYRNPNPAKSTARPASQRLPRPRLDCSSSAQHPRFQPQTHLTCLLALASRSCKARDRSQAPTRWSHDTNAAIPLPSRAISRLSSYVQNIG